VPSSGYPVTSKAQILGSQHDLIHSCVFATGNALTMPVEARLTCSWRLYYLRNSVSSLLNFCSISHAQAKAFPKAPMLLSALPVHLEKVSADYTSR